MLWSKPIRLSLCKYWIKESVKEWIHRMLAQRQLSLKFQYIVLKNRASLWVKNGDNFLSIPELDLKVASVITFEGNSQQHFFCLWENRWRYSLYIHSVMRSEALRKTSRTKNKTHSLPSTLLFAIYKDSDYFLGNTTEEPRQWKTWNMRLEEPGRN